MYSSRVFLLSPNKFADRVQGQNAHGESRTYEQLAHVQWSRSENCAAEIDNHELDDRYCGHDDKKAFVFFQMRKQVHACGTYGKCIADAAEDKQCKKCCKEIHHVAMTITIPGSV